jgi:hypothetical protein
VVDPAIFKAYEAAASMEAKRDEVLGVIRS